MGIARRLLALGTLVALAACSLPSVDEFASGSRAAETADAGNVAPLPTPRDGGATPPAEGGGPFEPSAVNLVATNASGFEQGTCAGAESYQSFAVASRTPRGGSWSCHVCRDGGPLYSLEYLSAPTRAGQRYHARAWVRRPPDAASVDVAIALRSHEGDVKLQVAESVSIATSDEWKQIDVETTLPARTTSLQSYVFAEPPLSDGPSCFLVDDIAVWLVP